MPRLRGAEPRREEKAEVISNVASARVRQHSMALSSQPRRPLKELFPSVDPAAISLLSSLLEVDPAKRSSALEALERPFFKEVYEPGKELTVPPIPQEEFAFNGRKLNAVQMRWLFLEEAALYHAELAEELTRGGGGGCGGGGHRGGRSS